MSEFEFPQTTLKLVEEAGLFAKGFTTTPLQGDPLTISIVYPKKINTELTSAVIVESARKQTHLFNALPNNKESLDFFTHVSYLIEKDEITDAWQLIADYLVKHTNKCTIIRKRTAGRECVYLRVTWAIGMSDVKTHHEDYYITTER